MLKITQPLIYFQFVEFVIDVACSDAIHRSLEMDIRVSTLVFSLVAKLKSR